ncbi:uncharacterized protein N7479_008006 [Penicillium vulpinum]|uniref:uncharacterized protein n=1 Tax=Penicillium vulpinum TaxID=29845 RepID=UPI002546D0FD|nr:uncharacterized protein N7479_008006 [Penicillium vulpinum]KAJ5960856.1 hypothetical protein N7479_008006 [Penicillium vulpinum]
MGSTEAFKSEKNSSQENCTIWMCLRYAIDGVRGLRDSRSGEFVIGAVRFHVIIHIAPSPRPRTSIDHFLRFRQADSLPFGLTGVKRGSLSLYASG